MSKVCLFGGAFDPPHLGHIQVANAIIKDKVADEVWYVPVGNHAFDKKMTSVEHRVKMLELAQEKNIENKQQKIKIELHEAKQAETNYTYDTLKALRNEYPQHQFFWIIGSDNLAEFHLWNDGKGDSYKKLLEEFNFYVYPRKGFPMKPLYDGMTPLLDMEEIDVSSTQVRKLVELGLPIDKMVISEVDKYIKKNELYL